MADTGVPSVVCAWTSGVCHRCPFLPVAAAPPAACFLYHKTMEDQLQRSIQQAAAVLKELGAREVYVIGSAARGTLRPGSDVDLAVSGLAPGLFFRAMGKAADLLDRPLDLIDLDQDIPFTRYL